MNLKYDVKKRLTQGASFDNFQELCAIMHGMVKFGDNAFYVDFEKGQPGKGIVYREESVEIEPLKEDMNF